MQTRSQTRVGCWRHYVKRRESTQTDLRTLNFDNNDDAKLARTAAAWHDVICKKLQF